MDMKYLLLWLEAPLQSWGSDSKFGVRYTLPFPTKSGIYGLLFSAMGASGPQEELLATFAQCKQSVISFVPIKKDNRTLIRRRISPLLMDFQMVGSGYNDKDSFEQLLIPKKKDGTKAVGGGAKMTYRYYLQDKKFAIIQEIPLDYEELLMNSLINPVFDIYLGRKNCVPTDFVYRGIFSSYEEAVEGIKPIIADKELVEDFTVFEGEGKNVDEIMTIPDVPIRYGEQKIYRERVVSIKNNTYE